MIYNLFKFLYKVILLIDLLLITFILLIACFLPYSLRPISKLVRWIFVRWSHAFKRFLGVELIVHQHHQNPLPKQYIVIANHPSIFEDIGMPMTFDAHFLGKAEVAKWPVVGRISRGIGCIFVQREDKDSRLAAREALAQGIKDGLNIGIFPEGGCKGRRIYTPFTTGAFDLSLQTGVPIIPVFLHYEAAETFEWLVGNGAEQVWKILTSRFATRANYHVYDPLYPSQFKHRDHYRTHVESLFLKWQEKHLD
ncbi:MAG: hypothetical protein CMF48_04190 [Legionellales bacterium]|nr:hypothetical protein [Legionellales bacterium]